MDAPIIKVGTVVQIDGHELTVIDINMMATIDGRSAVIRVCDEESAKKMQIKQMQQEHIGEEAMEGLKKLMGMFSGGKFPGIDSIEGDK